MQTEIILQNILLEIKNIKSNMVTKDEAKNFATKDDFEEIKKELKQHTKDIKKMKKDISEIKFVINGLAEDIGMLDNRTRSLVVYGK